MKKSIIISVEDWKRFKAYRQKLINEYYFSPLRPERPRIKKIKRKFLWWTWEDEIVPGWGELYACAALDRHLLAFIPKETIEEYLNFLARE